MKFAVLISLLVIIGMVYSACDSCGAECAPACGTRRFRACCFNYLRRKRGPDAAEFWTSIAEENQPKSNMPAIFVKYVPDEIVSNAFEDNLKTDDKIQD